MESAVRKSNTNNQIITIHQPNFAPWTGYFHKMLNADVFVYLDNVPFSKNSFQNRNRILINGNPEWLTVPVRTRGAYGMSTREIQINDQSDWRRKHLLTLEQNYRRCSGFKWVWEKLVPVYEKKEEYLFRFCIAINDVIRTMLRIEVPIVFASELTDVSGPSERLIAIVRTLEGGTYLSGPSGRKYLQEDLFKKADLLLRYHHYEPQPYKQQIEPFIPGLSVLDLLFNLGADAACWLRRESS